MVRSHPTLAIFLRAEVSAGVVYPFDYGTAPGLGFPRRGHSSNRDHCRPFPSFRTHGKGPPSIDGTRNSRWLAAVSRPGRGCIPYCRPYEKTVRPQLRQAAPKHWSDVSEPDRPHWRVPPRVSRCLPLVVGAGSESCASLFIPLQSSNGQEWFSWWDPRGP